MLLCLFAPPPPFPLILSATLRMREWTRFPAAANSLTFTCSLSIHNHAHTAHSTHHTPHTTHHTVHTHTHTHSAQRTAHITHETATSTQHTAHSTQYDLTLSISIHMHTFWSFETTFH